MDMVMQHARNVGISVLRGPGAIVRGAMNGGFWVAEHAGYRARLSPAGLIRFDNSRAAVANPNNKFSRTLDVVTNAALVGVAALAFSDNIPDGGTAVQSVKDAAGWAKDHSVFAAGVVVAGGTAVYAAGKAAWQGIRHHAGPVYNPMERGAMMRSATVAGLLLLAGAVLPQPYGLRGHPSVPPVAGQPDAPLTRQDYQAGEAPQNQLLAEHNQKLDEVLAKLAAGAAPSTGTPAVEPPKAGLAQFVSYSVPVAVLRAVGARDQAGLAGILQLSVQQVRDRTDGSNANREFVSVAVAPTGVRYVHAEPSGKWVSVAFPASSVNPAGVTAYFDKTLTPAEFAQVAGVRK